VVASAPTRGVRNRGTRRWAAVWAPARTIVKPRVWDVAFPDVSRQMSSLGSIGMQLSSRAASARPRTSRPTVFSCRLRASRQLSRLAAGRSAAARLDPFSCRSGPSAAAPLDQQGGAGGEDQAGAGGCGEAGEAGGTFHFRTIRLRDCTNRFRRSRWPLSEPGAEMASPARTLPPTGRKILEWPLGRVRAPWQLAVDAQARLRCARTAFSIVSRSRDRPSPALAACCGASNRKGGAEISWVSGRPQPSWIRLSPGGFPKASCTG